MFSASRDYFTGRMFRRQFVPSLISALGLAVGDMADAIVVGQRMGVVGLAAISLTLPVFMVINVIMHGFGLGASIRYSTQLARGEHVEALSGFQGIMLLVPALGVLLALAANLMLTPLLALLGTVPGDGALFETSREYLRIVVSGTPVYFASYLMNYFLRNADREKLASFGFTFGNLCDIALNILFVLVLDMGAAGAALSTVLGQIIAVCIYALGLAARGSELGFKPFNPSFRGAFGCFRVGFASSSQYLYSMVFILLANNLLIDMYGSTGVAVFDLVQNASCLILYIYEGTARAAQPLLSTFSGEHNDQGRARTLRLALVWGTLAGGAAILFVALLPNVVCTVFGIDGADAATLGAYALRVFCLGAAFAGASVVLESYCQSCGSERPAFWLATFRGALLLIPMTLLLSRFGPMAFWWLYPATEFGSLTLFLLIWRGRTAAQDLEAERILRRTIGSGESELSRLTAAVEEFCERWEASPKQSYFVTMSVEELCAVIQKKGLGGRPGVIQVTLIAQPDGVLALHIRDSAVSFNPFALDARRAGAGADFDPDALGVLVVREKAKEFYYRRYQGFNSLIVKI